MQRASMCRRDFLALSGAALLMDGATAQAPVRLVVPFGAGAVADALARAISQDLAQELGHPVLVDNRPGAGGTVGTASVAKAAPDGQTMILAAASHTLAAHLYANLPYDPIRDFQPLAHIGNFGYVVAAPARMGVNDLTAWLAAVKARPGKFNYASAGSGSASHLGMAYLLAKVGAQMEHIPMKSTGDAVNEMLAGRSQGIMSAQTGLVGFKGDDRIAFLAYTGQTRSKALAAVPTVAESALPGFVFESWNGVLAPTGLSRPVADRLSSSLYNVLRSPSVQERLARLGIETRPLDLADFRALLKLDWESAEAVVKAAGVRVQ